MSVDKRAGRVAAHPPRPRPARRAAATEDEIYARIHGAVLDHRLKPGTKLKEVALAEVFGVNRATVRKALARLAFARLIDLTPNRGATVASPSVGESRDLFAARRAVEAAIVDTVVHRITPAELRALRAHVVRERDAYRRGEMRRGLKLSLEFHRRLAGIAGNRVLAEFQDQLTARTPLVVLAYKGRQPDNFCGDDDHAEIVEAVAAGNAAKAVAAMNAHIARLEDQLDLTAASEAADDLADLLAGAAD